MPHQRKTRTRSTDQFPSRQQRKIQLIRAQLAAEAARIIATEGQHDFHVAKRKAAERIGTSERMALPSNLEVQDALVSYQNLYGGLQHAANLEKLRFAAIDAMQLLDGYSPRLVGPVLDGSAGKHARVTLHLFCDEAETLVLDFLARRMPFKQEQKRLRYSDRNFQTLPVFLIEVDNCTIELLVFPAISLRQAPPSPIDGKPQQRANQAELERLVKRTTSAA